MKIVITRPSELSHKFIDLLIGDNRVDNFNCDCHFEPLLIPTLEINFKKINIDLNKYNWIIFTSPRGVMGLYKNKNNIKNFDLSNKKIGVIGEETNKELYKLFNRYADVIPEKYVGEGFLNELKKHITENDKILLPTTPASRDVLYKNLNCDVVHVYSSEKPEDIKLKIGNLKEITKYENLQNKKIIITFTSGLTAKNFFDNCDNEIMKLLNGHYFVSIGPITKKVVDEYLDKYKNKYNINYSSLMPEKYTIEEMAKLIKNIKNNNYNI